MRRHREIPSSVDVPDTATQPDVVSGAKQCVFRPVFETVSWEEGDETIIARAMPATITTRATAMETAINTILVAAGREEAAKDAVKERVLRVIRFMSDERQEVVVALTGEAPYWSVTTRRAGGA